MQLRLTFLANGSIIYNVMCDTNIHTYEPLAQSAEHLTFNQRVWGSNPQWLTKKNPYSAWFAQGRDFSFCIKSRLYDKPTTKPFAYKRKTALLTVFAIGLSFLPLLSVIIQAVIICPAA